MRISLKLLLSTLLFSSQALALEVNVTIPAAIKEDDKAVGLVIPPTGVVEKTTVQKRVDSLGRNVITFSVSDREIGVDTTASALVQTTDGRTFFGHVVPLVPGRGITLPVCPPPQKPPSVNVTNQTGVLLSLIDNRENQINIQKEKLRMALTEDEMRRLAGLEKRLGLTNEKQISPEMSPYELVDRLSRLLVALRPTTSLKPAEQP